jgi:hypothetical protein
MRFAHTPPPMVWVLRPFTIAALVAALALLTWLHLVLSTLRAPVIGEPFPTIVSSAGYRVVAGILLLLMVGLGHELRTSRNSLPGLRRGHVVGASSGLVMLLAMQVLLHFVHAIGR